MNKQMLKSPFFAMMLCIVLLMGLVAPPARAGAWVRPKGELFMIPHIFVYRSCRFWTQSHHLTRGLCYHKLRFAPYMEYGLTDDFTMGAQPFLRRIEQSGTVSGPDWGDLELWGRYRLWKSGYRVLSTQLIFNIPFARTGSQSPLFPVVSQGQYFLDGRLLYGTGGLLSRRYDAHWYGEGQLGYRVHVKSSVSPYSILNGAADEIRVEGALGVSMDHGRWIFELKSLNTIGLQNPTGADDPDYDLFSVQPSIIHWLTPHVGVQVGGTYDFYGRNVGKGLAYFASLFLRFNRS